MREIKAKVGNVSAGLMNKIWGGAMVACLFADDIVLLKVRRNFSDG